MKKMNLIRHCENDVWRKTLKVMKLTVFLFFIAIMGVSASGFGQNSSITLKMENSRLQDVLKEIKATSGYTFVYNDRVINDVIVPKIDVKDDKIETVLDECLKSTGLTYLIKDNVVVIKKSVEQKKSNSINVQQPKTIKFTGKVVDEDGEPVPSAAVIIKGTVKGAATDINGEFSFEVPVGEYQFLVASSVGLETQEIEIAGKTEFHFVLRTDMSGLDEVVVVGYGTVDKKDLTGSVATVKSEALASIKTQSVESALAGQVAGLHIATSNGQPGKGSVVHIRGLSQIKGDNQPLYVVDGVPIIVNPAFGTGANPQNISSRENPLLAINPENVERIDVLKDASAAAIYGSRAANGVVLITTKRGSKNQKPSVRFSTTAVIQNPVNTHDFMNAEEYIATAKWQAPVSLANGRETPNDLEVINNPESFFGDADIDWQDEITNKNALWTQYNLSVSGGTDKTNYMMSASVSDQEGVLIGNEFKRYSYSSNIDSEVTERLKLGASISYNYSVNNTSGISSLLNGGYRPDIPILNEDGSRGSFYDGSLEVNTLNPIEGDGKIRNKTIAKNMYGSIYGDFKILDGLNFRSQLNVSANDATVRNFDPSFNREYEAEKQAQPGAVLNSNNNSSWSTSFENTLSFNKTINDVHKVNSVIGVSWDQSRYDLEGHRLRMFPDDEVLINQNSASIIENPVSDHFQNALNSQFGRINYVYDSRYMATFTVRRDGSIKFGEKSRYGFFPSGALAWNVHNESFMNNIESVDKLKLRASLGRTGSDNLPAFSYLVAFQGGFYYNGINGIGASKVPNERLKWETTDQLDLGLEFSLFNYRINAEIVYFEKNTSDIILFVPLSNETGSSHWSDNVADVSNKGWEFAVNGDVFRGDFTWNSAFNISFVDNKVVDMNGGSTEIFGSNGIIEGEPIGVITGYDVLRIAQTQDEIDALNAAAEGGVYHPHLKAPGDYIFRDVDGDGKITSDDRTVLGDITPDFFGGWNNTFSYKNFALGMNWIFSYGAEKSYRKIFDLYSVDVAKNFDRIVLDTWTPEKTDAPYARWGSDTHSSSRTSRSVEDASYIKLQSLSLAFTLPNKVVNKLGITSAKFSLVGNNLLTITDYPGLDPQDTNTRYSNTATQTGDEGLSYPNTKTYSIGLSVTF